MWGNLLDRGLQLAEKAKKAAEELDKQLNESVGLTSKTVSQNPNGSVVPNAESGADDVSNEGEWEDDDIDVDVTDDAHGDVQIKIGSNGTLIEPDPLLVEQSSDIGPLNPAETISSSFGESSDPEPLNPAENVPSESEVETSPPRDSGDPNADDTVVNDHGTLSNEGVTGHDTNNESNQPLNEGEDSTVSSRTNTENNKVTGATENSRYVAEEICTEEDPLIDGKLDDEVVSKNEQTENILIGVSDNDDKNTATNENTYYDTLNRKADDHSHHSEKLETSVLMTDSKQSVRGQGEDDTGYTVAEHALSSETTEHGTLHETTVSSETQGFVSVTETLTGGSTLLEAKLRELQNLVDQRELQLLEKNKMLLEMESQYESEKRELSAKIVATKEEAKRRIAVVKEKLVASESQLHTINAAHVEVTEALNAKESIIVAIRVEGEKLARKQADMEKAVRNSKAEAREIRESLAEALQGKEDALSRIRSLEEEIATTKRLLSEARVGESQAEKLENELRQLREENERRQTVNLSLEQQVKELKSRSKELVIELEESKKGAAAESEQERRKLLKEQTDFVKELENTIRLTEREAATREDALRHELEEVRKRWQDAVRRADALSMDIQASTAPLLRQIDSLNRQNRARSSAWTDLETQLRSELEGHAAQSEKMSLELNEWKCKCIRMERLHKDEQMELAVTKNILEENAAEIKKLQEKVTKAEAEKLKMKNELSEAERLGSEGLSKLRSEMARSLVEKDERYRSQIENIRFDLDKERELRSQLESQLKELIETADTLVTQEAPTQHVREFMPQAKTLLHSEGQVAILASALSDLAHDSDSEAEEDYSDKHKSTTNGSFAAIDQLTSSLKSAKKELNLLTKRLEESEISRNALLEDLASSRSAKEKLPLFEAKVQELMAENIELTEEVRGLREDIIEVKELYRAQLNMLLEEKASSSSVLALKNEGS